MQITLFLVTMCALACSATEYAPIGEEQDREGWEVDSTVMVLSEAANRWCLGRIVRRGQTAAGRVGWKVRYNLPGSDTPSDNTIDLLGTSPLLRNPDEGDVLSVYDEDLDMHLDTLVSTTKPERDAMELDAMLAKTQEIYTKERSFYELRLMEQQGQKNQEFSPVKTEGLEVGSTVMVHVHPLSTLDSATGEAGWIPGLLDKKLNRDHWVVKYYADWPKNTDMRLEEYSATRNFRDQTRLPIPPQFRDFDSADLNGDGTLKASTDVEYRRFFLPISWSNRSQASNLFDFDSEEETPGCTASEEGSEMEADPPETEEEDLKQPCIGSALQKWKRAAAASSEKRAPRSRPPSLDLTEPVSKEAQVGDSSIPSRPVFIPYGVSKREPVSKEAQVGDSSTCNPSPPVFGRQISTKTPEPFMTNDAEPTRIVEHDEPTLYRKPGIDEHDEPTYKAGPKTRRSVVVQDAQESKTSEPSESTSRRRTVDHTKPGRAAEPVARRTVDHAPWSGAGAGASDRPDHWEKQVESDEFQELTEADLENGNPWGMPSGAANFAKLNPNTLIKVPYVGKFKWMSMTQAKTQQAPILRTKPRRSAAVDRAEPPVPSQPVITASPRRRRVEVPTNNLARTDRSAQWVRFSRGNKYKVLGRGWTQNRLSSNFPMEWPQELGFGYEGGAPRFAQARKNEICDIIDIFGLFPDAQLVTAAQAHAAWQEYRHKFPDGRWNQRPPWGDNWLEFCLSIRWHKDNLNKVVGVPDRTRQAPADLTYRVLNFQHNTRAAVMYSDTAREALWVGVWKSHHDQRVEAQNTIPRIRWWNQGRKPLNGCLQYDQARDAFDRLTAREIEPMIQEEARRVRLAEESETDASMQSDASESRRSRKRHRKLRGDISDMELIKRQRAKMELMLQREARAERAKKQAMHERLTKQMAEHQAELAVRAREEAENNLFCGRPWHWLPGETQTAGHQYRSESFDESPVSGGPDGSRLRFFAKPTRSYSQGHFGSGIAIDMEEERAQLQRLSPAEPAEETAVQQEETLDTVTEEEEEQQFQTQFSQAMESSGQSYHFQEVADPTPTLQTHPSFNSLKSLPATTSEDGSPNRYYTPRAGADEEPYDTLPSGAVHVSRFKLVEDRLQQLSDELSHERHLRQQSDGRIQHLEARCVQYDADAGVWRNRCDHLERETATLTARVHELNEALRAGSVAANTRTPGKRESSRLNTPRSTGSSTTDDYSPRPRSSSEGSQPSPRSAIPLALALYSKAAVTASRQSRARPTNDGPLSPPASPRRRGGPTSGLPQSPPRSPRRARSKSNQKTVHAPQLTTGIRVQLPMLAVTPVTAPVRASVDPSHLSLDTSSDRATDPPASRTATLGQRAQPSARPGDLQRDRATNRAARAAPAQSNRGADVAPRRTTEYTTKADPAPVSSEWLDALARQAAGIDSESEDDTMLVAEPITECPKGHPLQRKTAAARSRSRCRCDICMTQQPPGFPIRQCRRCNYDLCLECANVPREEFLEEMQPYFNKTGFELAVNKKFLKPKPSRGIRFSDSSEDDSDTSLPLVRDDARRSLTEEMRAMERLAGRAQGTRAAQAETESKPTKPFRGK